MSLNKSMISDRYSAVHDGMHDDENEDNNLDTTTKLALAFGGQDDENRGYWCHPQPDIAKLILDDEQDNVFSRVYRHDYTSDADFWTTDDLSDGEVENKLATLAEAWTTAMKEGNIFGR